MKIEIIYYWRTNHPTYEIYENIKSIEYEDQSEFKNGQWLELTFEDDKQLSINISARADRFKITN